MEVETDYDARDVQHLPLHRDRNKMALMAELWKALCGRRTLNSPFFDCPDHLSPERRLLGVCVCVCMCVCMLAQLCLTLCDPMITKSARLLCLWDFPGKYT